MWFAVPFTLATTLGLTGLALDLPLSAKEVASGLVPPAVAYHLFGKGGVILITIMVFMAGALCLWQDKAPAWPAVPQLHDWCLSCAIPLVHQIWT